MVRWDVKSKGWRVWEYSSRNKSGDGLLGLGEGIMGTGSEGRDATKSENKFFALPLGKVGFLKTDPFPRNRRLLGATWKAIGWRTGAGPSSLGSRRGGRGSTPPLRSPWLRSLQSRIRTSPVIPIEGSLKVGETAIGQSSGTAY